MLIYKLFCFCGIYSMNEYDDGIIYTLHSTDTFLTFRPCSLTVSLTKRANSSLMLLPDRKQAM